MTPRHGVLSDSRHPAHRRYARTGFFMLSGSRPLFELPAVSALLHDGPRELGGHHFPQDLVFVDRTDAGLYAALRAGNAACGFADSFPLQQGGCRSGDSVT